MKGQVQIDQIRIGVTKTFMAVNPVMPSMELYSRVDDIFCRLPL